MRARVTWSALVEPGDVVAGTLVDAARCVGRPGVGARGGRRRREAALARRSRRGAGRSRPRFGRASPARSCGGRSGCPTSTRTAAWTGSTGSVACCSCRPIRDGPPAWPVSGSRRPSASGSVAQPTCERPSGRSVSIVGSRASTTYGERVAFDLADGLTSRDVCVVSGGAYGIDAAAHRGAVARDGATARGPGGRRGPCLPGRQRPAAGGRRLLRRRRWCRRCLRRACPPRVASCSATG